MRYHPRVWCLRPLLQRALAVDHLLEGQSEAEPSVDDVVLREWQPCQPFQNGVEESLFPVFAHVFLLVDELYREASPFAPRQLAERHQPEVVELHPRPLQ